MKEEKIGLLKKKALALSAATMLIASLSGCSNDKNYDDRINYGIIIVENKVLVIEGGALNYGKLHVDNNYFGNIMVYKGTKEELEILLNTIAPADAEIIYYKDIDPDMVQVKK